MEILQAAQDELAHATSYYEQIEPGLGVRFKTEARERLTWVTLNPEVPSLRANGYRRVNLRIFPYYIAYFAFDGVLWVLAIAHTRRRPEYWLRRKNQLGH